MAWVTVARSGAPLRGDLRVIRTGHNGYELSMPDKVPANATAVVIDMTAESDAGTTRDPRDSAHAGPPRPASHRSGPPHSSRLKFDTDPKKPATEDR
jgi:hypothetical protein